jgi:hypothetical protein
LWGAAKLSNEAAWAKDLISQIDLDVSEAKNYLLQAKVLQALHANAKRGPDDVFEVGDWRPVGSVAPSAGVQAQG